MLKINVPILPMVDTVKSFAIKKAPMRRERIAFYAATSVLDRAGKAYTGELSVFERKVYLHALTGKVN